MLNKLSHFSFPSPFSYLIISMKFFPFSSVTFSKIINNLQMNTSIYKYIFSPYSAPPVLFHIYITVYIYGIYIYITIKKDPTKSIISSFGKILTKSKNLEFISITTHRAMTNIDGLLPRVYSLPKVHKPNCPFRIIISSVDSTLHAIAIFLQKTIILLIPTNIPTAHSHIDNSFDLVKKLTNMHIDDFSLILLDVLSLFTNIPIELALKNVVDRWNYISLDCNIPRDEFFKDLVDFRIYIFFISQQDLQTKIWSSHGLFAFTCNS